MTSSDSSRPFPRGILFERSEQWEEAAGAFAEAAQLDPDAAEPFFRMGLALARLGLHPSALQAYDRALGRDRRHIGARLAAGVSLRRLGRLGEALRLLDDLPGPHPPEWINNHAEFLLEQGRVEEAIRELRGAESFLRRSPNLHSSLIRALIYDPRASARDLFEETGRWNAWHAARPTPPVLLDPDTATRLRQRLRAVGIDPQRVGFHADNGAILTLAVLREMDIVLDSFPFNGDATTCDALWMGVPVITLCGGRLSARRAAGLLHTVGRTEWIAASEKDYCTLAAEWASNLPRLAAAHADLPRQVRSSPLCDAAAVTRAIEAEFRAAWHSACADREK